MAGILLPGDAGFADVLAGKKFSAGANYNGTGTMPNNGAATLTPGASNVAIPAGYHNGAGIVSAVNVPAANVLTGTTIAGTAGTMPNRGAVTLTPSTANQAIATGYHNGSGVVQGDPNLVAGNILSGASIFGVAGSVVPGTPSASGTATSSASFTTNGTSFATGFSSAGGFVTPTGGGYAVTVTGLSFTAKRVVIMMANSGTNYTNGDGAYSVYNADMSFNSRNASYKIAMHRYWNSANEIDLYYMALAAGFTVTATGFVLPFPISSQAVSWYAYA